MQRRLPCISICLHLAQEPPCETCFAGSLESVNSSILTARRFFKEVVGKKSGFYVN